MKCQIGISNGINGNMPRSARKESGYGIYHVMMRGTRGASIRQVILYKHFVISEKVRIFAHEFNAKINQLKIYTL